MTNERHEDKWVKAAARLAGDISPERDLWPGIAAAIADHSGRGRLRWTPSFAQAAAVLALVGASSMVTWYVAREEPRIVEVYRPAITAEPAAYGGRVALGPEYLRTHGEVMSALESELEKLSPQVRADVERNLAVMHQAIADISEALDREPNNSMLQDLLADAYREELVTMQRVGTLTRQVMSRQDI